MNYVQCRKIAKSQNEWICLLAHTVHITCIVREIIQSGHFPWSSSKSSNRREEEEEVEKNCHYIGFSNNKMKNVQIHKRTNVNVFYPYEQSNR